MDSARRIHRAVARDRKGPHKDRPEGTRRREAERKTVVGRENHTRAVDTVAHHILVEVGRDIVEILQEVCRKTRGTLRRRG